jgi:prevent-host-death family protein
MAELQSVTVTLDQAAEPGNLPIMQSVTLKQLHATTGEIVRRAGAGRHPVVVTDRGQPIAILGSPQLMPRSRRRVLSPEFKALMRQPPGADLSQDIDAVRGDR